MKTKTVVRKVAGALALALRRGLISWRAQASLVLLLAVLPGLWLVTAGPTVSAPPCPCNVFTTPTGHSEFNDGSDVELGFKFQADKSGYITGVRFYKQGAMSGTHVGRLWQNDGTPITSATFDSETASGWQEVSFGSPVAVTAGTTYVASVTMNDGRYIATSNNLASTVTNYPLRAPASAQVSGNGVFNVNAGSFPTSSFNSTNYWIDVAYRNTASATPPTVSSTTPANGATDVSRGASITVDFDQPLDPASVTSSTFIVRDSENNPTAGTVTYSTTTDIAKFVPSSGFDLNETYTATLEGGSGTSIENLDGDALASDYTWTFTIDETDACPCSLKNRANPANAGTFDETVSVELGVKIKPSANGYIHSIRFYKPITSTESTHTVNLWDSTGNNMGTATTSNETEFGWQEATFSSPIAVSDGQLLIASYFTNDGIYVATNQTTGNGLGSNISNGYLTAHAVGSTENAATGSGNNNGVFRTNSAGYPSSGSSNGSYYWIDAVFAIDATIDDPLAVQQTTPKSNAYGVLRGDSVSAVFNRALDGATVTGSTVRMFDSNGGQVAGSASYNATDHSVNFDPTGTLTAGETYTVRLGASIADTDTVTLGSEYSWSFTAGSALSTDHTQGPGGPILVITSSSDLYTKYYAEILRTEGLNYFDVKEIGTVSSSTLNAYDSVVLSEMALSQAQADMFSAWVTAGGNLVAMRPDDKLASLLGLTDQGTTRTNQYLLIDTSSAPGSGLVNETIQFHGVADNYALNGATAIATLYSDASTATTNPAVTKRDVGSNGGQAIAFSYDLAKTVVASHQGNEAWAGQSRDGDGPVRGNDMFYGNAAGDPQPDWTASDKFHIPYADEQQRLLANILTEFTRDKKPLPRFWYLPNEHKNALVMAGDDHGLGNDGGTQSVMNNWLNESTTNCSVNDWECVRASHYTYTSSALTNARAAQFDRLGFELGVHASNGGGCGNYTSFGNLSTLFTNDLASWHSKYTSLPNQRTHRFHCYLWSDWDSQPKVSYNNGIRYDINYVVYPGAWLGNRAPVMTGSLMNMRFTGADGDLLDVYQGVTNLDNTAANATAIAAIMDNTANSNNFYGAIGTHYDMSDSYDDTLYAAAKSRGIPIISADMMLTWLDGRNSSNFSGLSGSNGEYTFMLNAAEGAYGLQAMMPIQDAGGTLTSLKRGDNTVSYATQTIKGVQYAVFDANPGAYTVRYSDYVPPSSGGGGSNNGGGGSESSDGGSTTSQGTSAIPGTSTPVSSDESPETADEDTTTNPASSPSSPSRPGQLPTTVTEGDGQPDFAWAWILIGIVSLAGLGWLLFFLLKRRRQHDVPPPDVFNGNQFR